MNFTQGMGQLLQQDQKQILSQRMIQSMELLQLPQLQLEERIQQVLQTNPVLELDEFDDPEDESESSSEETIQTLAEKEEEIAIGKSPDNREDFQVADDFANLYDDTINEKPSRSQNWLEEQASRHADLMNNLPDSQESLESHLIEQLNWFDISPSLREMCERIIRNLDDNGYLVCPVEELLEDRKNNDQLTLIKQALKLVQTFEPHGVGARNLQECLLLQIPKGIPHESKLRRLIRDHLDDLERNRFPHLSRITGFTYEFIQELLRTIQQLTPRPGSLFGNERRQPIIPDLIIEPSDRGDEWEVRLPESLGSSLRISPYYLEMSKQKAIDKDTKNYLRENLVEARWFIDAINQRKSTLLKVAREIIQYQHDFLIQGPQAIRPLKLQQIADRLNVHIATISRACDDKWIQTPQGIFPLKKFFTGSIGVSDQDEEGVAQGVARIKLREFIEAEDKKNPRSDEELVVLMDKAGIKISRRTIAKYRLAMNIPGSRQRKNWA